MYWYFLGEADTKDCFYDDDENTISVSLITDLNTEDDKKNVVEHFCQFLKEVLSEEQLNILRSSLECLYLRQKDFIDNKYYFKNKYHEGMLKAEIHLLTTLNKR